MRLTSLFTSPHLFSPVCHLSVPTSPCGLSRRRETGGSQALLQLQAPWPQTVVSTTLAITASWGNYCCAWLQGGWKEKSFFLSWKMLWSGLVLSDTGLEGHQHAAPLACCSLRGLVAICMQTSHLKNKQTNQPQIILVQEYTITVASVLTKKHWGKVPVWVTLSSLRHTGTWGLQQFTPENSGHKLSGHIQEQLV